MSLEDKFELHIREQHQIAKRATGYKAPTFLRMVNEMGALQTAQDLLVGKTKIHDGLTQLVLHNRLDLSLEANVIKAEWRQLFSDDEIKTALKRLKELNYQVPDIDDVAITNEEKTPGRRSYELNSIIRDQGISKKIKEIYEYKCQVCDIRLEAGESFYAEAAHIKPLGNPHNGPDLIENMLCLCPNHHKLFDMGGFYIEDNLNIPTLNVSLSVNERHKINFKFVKYHREWCKNS